MNFDVLLTVGTWTCRLYNCFLPGVIFKEKCWGLYIKSPKKYILAHSQNHNNGVTGYLLRILMFSLFLFFSIIAQTNLIFCIGIPIRFHHTKNVHTPSRYNSNSFTHTNTLIKTLATFAKKSSSLFDGVAKSYWCFVCKLSKFECTAGCRQRWHLLLAKTTTRVMVLRINSKE